MATVTDEPLLGEDTPQHEAEIRRDWKIFFGVTFLFAFGFALYSGPFQNFLRDQMGASPTDLGRLESLRETPGLLAALTAGTLAAFAESRVAALGLLITGIGIGLTGAMPSYWPLVAVTVFWSIGFHLYSAMSPAITLVLAKGREGGRHLGRVGSVGAVATIAGLGLGWVASELWPRLTGKQVPYDFYFIIGGVAIVASALLCSRLSTHAAGQPRARIILRREYSLYYLLIFLEGCRRQIFSIFASFTLILVYNASVQEMLLLWFVNAALIAITAPAMGRLIDKKGERGPLMWYAVGLMVVFFGYAIVEQKWALYALFLIDHVLFSFGIGFNTYLHRIVRPGELTPCLSMGVTMNHVAAVTVPWLGAELWVRSGNYQLPFWVGVGIAAFSLVATGWLPKGRVEHVA